VVLVHGYPKRFVADLRRLRPWPSLRGALWRSPDLVRLTYGELARLVLASIGPDLGKVLYVGPGLGHIALELARAGHDVTGVEIDQGSLTMAARAAGSDPWRAGRGALSYELGEFPTGFRDRGPYDRILFCRVLHHIPDPAEAVDRAADLLRPGGRVVCVEFAHDRMGRPEARWVSRARRRLARSGWWPEPVADRLEVEADRLASEWRAQHEEEGLDPLAAMLDPLRRSFRLRPAIWHPYLFWELAADMRVPPDQEGSVARRLRNSEASMLRRSRLRGVLFSTWGTLRDR
jgi:SAM-dependent methyltransferase